VRLRILACFIFSLFNLTLFAQSPRPLLWEMNRLDVNTAMVWSSSGGIEEHALWSENSDALIFYENGHWSKLDLNEIFLSPADWLDHPIGSSSGEVLDSVTTEDLKIGNSITKYGDRTITTSKGVTLELKEEGFSTAFIRKDNKKKAKTLWQTGMENCYSLSLSPDERFVAFISETNGLMVYCIDESTYKTGIPPAVLQMNNAINELSPKTLLKTEAYISKAIALDNNYSEPYFWKAYIESYRENDSLAIVYLNKAIEVDPNFASYYYTLYQVYSHSKNTDMAIKSLETYIRIKPYDSHGYYDLGMIYKEMGKTELACEHMKMAREMHSNRAKKLIPELCK